MNRRSILKAAAGLAASLGFAQASRAIAVEAGDEGSGPRCRGNEVVFIVSVHVKSGNEAEFLRLVTPVLDTMRHESTFINAVLHRDPEDPTRFMIYETWADLDDVAQIQIHRQYRKPYLERLPEILREERQIQMWRPMRGDFTFSTAAWTSRAELGA